MEQMSFFAELGRSNVFRVGAAYAVVARLLIQIANALLPRLGALKFGMISAGQLKLPNPILNVTEDTYATE
jgi:hypothetical protein